MKKLSIILLVFLLLFTSCGEGAREIFRIDLDDNITCTSTTDVDSARLKPIVFESDVLGTIEYRLNSLEYIDALNPTFEFKDGELYHAGKRLDDLPQLLRDNLNPYTLTVSDEVTVICVEMMITRTKNGNLPDLDKSDEIPIDCLKIYSGIDLSTKKYDDAYSIFASGGAAAYSDSVKLKTGEAQSVLLYYAIKSSDLEYKKVYLSVQPSAVNDLQSKDVCFITLSDAEHFKISEKNGNMGFPDAEGYFNINLGDEQYYIVPDFSSEKAKTDADYFGVGIYRVKAGEDEELAVIPNVKLCHKGNNLALMQNGIIYFAVYEQAPYDIGRYGFTQMYADLVIYSYNLMQEKLTELYTFTYGNLIYLDFGSLVRSQTHDHSQYISFTLDYYLGDMPTEVGHWDESKHITQTLAINTTNRMLSRLDEDGRSTYLLFEPENVSYKLVGESVTVPTANGRFYHDVNSVSVFDTIADTEAIGYGTYSDTTCFLVLDMTVYYDSIHSSAVTEDYQFGLVATTYPDTVISPKLSYPEGIQEPEIIYVSDLPNQMTDGEKHPCKVVIAVDKQYIENRDVFLADTIHGSVSQRDRDFMQLFTAQLVELESRELNQHIFGNGFFDIEHKGKRYSFINKAKTKSKYEDENYAYISHFETENGNIIADSKILNRALFGSTLLYENGIVYYTYKDNRYNEGADSSKWEKAPIVLAAEPLDQYFDRNSIGVLYEFDDPTITDIRVKYVKDNYLYFDIISMTDGTESVTEANVIINNTITVDRELNTSE